MAWKRCNTCGGEYRDVLPDNTTYFHACPPRRLVRVRHADGTREIVRPDQVIATDAVIEDVYRPRPNHRDENTMEWQEQGGRRTRVLRAEGGGAETIAAPADT